MDPSKLDSMSTLTSTITEVVSTNMSLEVYLVATPSKLLVGAPLTELTTGSLLTHGELHGENLASSESKWVNAVLKATSMPAKLTSQASDSTVSYNCSTI